MQKLDKAFEIGIKNYSTETPEQVAILKKEFAKYATKKGVSPELALTYFEEKMRSKGIEPSRDKFKIGQTAQKDGKTWHYIGDNKWSDK